VLRLLLILVVYAATVMLYTYALNFKKRLSNSRDTVPAFNCTPVDFRPWYCFTCCTLLKQWLSDLVVLSLNLIVLRLILILALFGLLNIIKTVAIRSRGTVPLFSCAQVDTDPGPV
jgi:hypothetical protein